MRRLLVAVLFALLHPGFTPLAAQIPPRKTVTVASAADARRLLVATPGLEAGVDAGRGAEFAGLLRKRLAQSTGGRYQIVSREALNRVLTGSGYEADAPLGDAAVRALATQLQAAYVVSATMRLEEDGRLTVSASLAPPSDAAPTRQTVTQEAGQSLEAVASALAEQLLRGVQ